MLSDSERIMTQETLCSLSPKSCQTSLLGMPYLSVVEVSSFTAEGPGKQLRKFAM